MKTASIVVRFWQRSFRLGPFAVVIVVSRLPRWWRLDVAIVWRRSAREPRTTEA